MATVAKSMPKSLRQSVTIPKPLAEEARRVAEERRVTFSAALVYLAERGVKAEREAQEKLKRTYKQYIKEQDPEKKLAAGDDLIRSIFGADSIA
jgi:DnaJ-domain-containing protein 1